jgi:D-threo-aldose 1-dehydrogenase
MSGAAQAAAATVGAAESGTGRVQSSRGKIGAERVGFGTTEMPGPLTTHEAFAVLDAALEAGVRHIDTARMYCHGEAETVLGAFIRDRGADLTVVTKAGMHPPTRLARAAAKLLPGFNVGPQTGKFAASDIRASVETSLRELRRERLDALLLHEIRAGEVTPGLKDTLVALQREGKIGAYGIATSVDDAEAIIAAHPDICGIVQVPAQWLDHDRQRPAGSVLIVHSVLGVRLVAVLSKLRDAQTARWLKEETGLAAADVEDIGRLLLQAAVSQNADGVTLFTSNRPQRIAGNMAAAAANLDGSAVRIVERLLRGSGNAERAVS